MPRSTHNIHKVCHPRLYFIAQWLLSALQWNLVHYTNNHRPNITFIRTGQIYMPNATCNGDNPWLTGSQSQEKDQLLLFDMDVSCHRHFFLVLLLNHRWSPPLRFQASHCSTYYITIIIITTSSLLLLLLMSVTGLFFLVLRLNQQWSPPPKYFPYYVWCSKYSCHW